ncbi:MAG: HEAT repeat domain-containing protein [Leptospirales bacterium]|jgi:hypothetical protein
MNAKRTTANNKAGPSRLRLLLAGGAIFALGAALLFTLSDSGSKSGGAEGPGGGNSGGVSGGEYSGGRSGPDLDTLSELLEYRMDAGKAYEYSFTRSMDAQVNGEKMVDLELGGLLTPHVVRADNGRLDLIVHVRLDKTAGIDAEELPTAKRSGGAPAYLAHLQIDRAGQPMFLRFSGDTPDPAEQGLIRDVISTWLQPLPGPGSRPRKSADGEAGRSWFASTFGFGGGEGDAPVFAVRGTDTQGLYDAALSLLADEEAGAGAGENFRYDLSKEKYSDSLTPIKIEESQHKIVWKIQHGVFSGSAGKDQFLMGPSEFQVDSSLQYVYNLNEVGPAQYTEADLARFTINGDIYDVESYLSDREVQVPERVQAKPWREIKPQLAAVTAEMDGEKRTEVFNTLAVSVRADPTLAAQAARAARDFRSDDHRFQMVMGALSYAGSPAAQDELLAMYANGGLDAHGRESVIDAFTLMSEPATPEALNMLQNAFGSDDPDIRGRAGLALGSAQRNNPGEKLRQWIRDEWRAAKNDVQRQTVLEYIGNSGDPELMTIIKEALKSDDFSLQQLALNSTRFMDTIEVNGFLLQQFQDKGLNQRLRYEALGSLALHRWEERFLPIMENCVRQESMEAMRMRCARFTLEQLRHERRMKDLLRGQRATGTTQSWQEFVDRETAD